MKKYNVIIGLTAISSIMFSCMENRELEYKPRTETNDWIVAQLNDVYLWNKNIGSGNRFAIPDIFFYDAISRNDNCSFIDIEGNTNRLTEKKGSYGFEYYTETVEGKAIAARVLIVYKGSPAEKAGLKRGDIITGYNGIILTTNNIENIEKGGEVTFDLSTYKIKENTEEEESKKEYEWEKAGSVKLGPSTVQEYNPFFCDTVYNIEGKKIAYLMFNKVNQPGNRASYKEEINTILKKFTGCDDVIIDFRFNSKNDINLMTTLASSLCKGNENDTFLVKKHNENYTAKDSIIHFTTNGETPKIEKEKIYFITSKDTKQEAESAIRGVMPYAKTVIVGENTGGENAILDVYVCPSYPQYVIYPAVAAYYSSNQETDNMSSIAANWTINERSLATETYKEIGNTEEILLKNTIDIILGKIDIEEPVAP